MEDIIVKLLKENGRIIIPEFGAFILKSKSPIKVIFNEFLQYNDGALISALADKENISRDDAAQKIKEYIATINASLNSGNPINYGELGTLTKSATGKIAIADSEVIPTKKEITEEKTANRVEFDLTKKEETEKQATQQKPSEVKKKTEEVKSQPKPTPKPTPKAPPVVEKKTPPTPKKEVVTPAPPKTEPKKEVAPPAITSKKTTTTATTQKPKQTSPISEYYNDGSANNRMKYIIWGIVIVLVNIPIIGYFLFNDEIKEFFNKDEEVQTEQIIETPSITDESILMDSAPLVEEELVIEEPEEPEPQIAYTGTKYYVVAGVFEIEANADRLVRKLNEQGYNSEKFGRIGRMHAVSYDVFPTKSEADRYMYKIQREVDSKAWVRAVD